MNVGTMPSMITNGLMILLASSYIPLSLSLTSLGNIAITAIILISVPSRRMKSLSLKPNPNLDGSTVDLLATMIHMVQFTQIVSDYGYAFQTLMFLPSHMDSTVCVFMDVPC
ncbi:hypothetical protein CK203_074662 [Vitis vinifera]|uniref:Uncharacterized protein n=1 Tax=Vitis vinifera TaxID=29760 RepID=A0A438DWG1_VITVI|nr:hypothetical protein CK203_074662 [Vitis vinifera]